MTTIINIETSKYQLSDLLTLVQGGNEVIVQEGAKIVARLLPPEEEPVAQKAKPFIFDLSAASGKMVMSDDFDDELPMEFWLGDDA